MKKLIIVTILMMSSIWLSGCGRVLDQVKKGDADFAAYLDVETMTPDCKAAIAQCDADISPDPVSMRNIAAVTKYADKESPIYQKCYNGAAWLYYKGKKYEGAIRTMLKKLTELGVMAQ
jgi:hypothetical protein